MHFPLTFLPIFAAVLAAVSAHTPRNTHSPNNPYSNTRRRCGAPEPDQASLDEADVDESSARVVSKFGQASGLNRQAKEQINVRTFVHVITTSSSVGKYSQAQIDMQLLAMNKAYTPHAISFTLANTSYTANDQWAWVSAESAEELQMKRALRQGTYGDLNLYFIEALGGDILGICSFPKNLQKSPGQNLDVLDGCMLAGGTMPGGDLTDYNMGGTAIHETGHWFGLFHPFQGNSCSGKGDRLGDTPMQSKETVGCPSQPTNSCPGQPGMDNIHNYMDYSSDPCYSEFTPGQQRRAHTQYNKWRAQYAGADLRPAQQGQPSNGQQHPHAPHSNTQPHPGKGQQSGNNPPHGNGPHPNGGQHPGASHSNAQASSNGQQADSSQQLSNSSHSGAQSPNDADTSAIEGDVLVRTIPGVTIPRKPEYAGLVQYVTSPM